MVVVGTAIVGTGTAIGGAIGLVVGFVIAVPGVVRSVMLGVTIGRDEVIVRNLFRTRRFALADVRQFSILDAPWWVRKLNHQTHLVLRTGATVPITVMALPQFRSMYGPGRARCAAMNRFLKFQRQR